MGIGVVVWVPRDGFGDRGCGGEGCPRDGFGDRGGVGSLGGIFRIRDLKPMRSMVFKKGSDVRVPWITFN